MQLYKVIITRHQQDVNQTTGVCKVLAPNGTLLFTAMSLERGWRNNERNVSCVPTGVYNLALEWSPRFKQDLWELKNVPGRSECKFHASNYWYELNGCIALGLDLKDINKDGYRDVTSSRVAMRRFHKVLKGQHRAKLLVEMSNQCQCYA